MKIKASIEQLIYTPAAGESCYKKILLFPLCFISLIYRFIVRSRHILYQTGLLRSYQLSCPIVSIGNITVGGTGKTPMTIYLAQLLREYGVRPVILSRGYKSKKPGGTTVVSDETAVLLDVREAGDEAFLLAQTLPGIPIVIGPDRVASGRFACEQFKPDILILDDGFQHFRLKRDMDIVLIDLCRGLGNGHLLPRGILREPRNALGRAQIIIFTKQTGEGEGQSLKQLIKAENPHTPTFNTRYQVLALKEFYTDKRIDPQQIKGQRILALSGIGNPLYFSFLLKQAGLTVAEELTLPDHHDYTAKDASELHKHLARVDYIVTTAKDSCKMDRKIFRDLPILILEVVLKMEDEDNFKNILFKCIGKFIST